MMDLCEVQQRQGATLSIVRMQLMPVPRPCLSFEGWRWDVTSSQEAARRRKHAFDDALRLCRGMGAAVRVCLETLPAPTCAGDDHRWLFPEQTPREVAVGELAVKTVSTLQAALVLWQHSHFQEVNTLLRIANESCEDAQVLCVPLDTDEISLVQQRKLDEFYEASIGTDGKDWPKQPPMMKRDEVAAHLGTSRAVTPCGAN